MITNETYRHYVEAELGLWLFEVKRPQGIFGKLAQGMQGRINSLIQEKIHRAISSAIENMVKAVLVGSSWIHPSPKPDLSFLDRESKIRERIRWYQRTASVEGGLTGAGGILLGLADFPAFLTIKMKMLFDISALYGFDTSSYRERLFLLYVFQLSFSNQQRRNDLIGLIENWKYHHDNLPKEFSEFDWKTFQLDYRDYMDLAKLAQLLPIIGAPVGAIANYKLTGLLGRYAMNCFRLRLR